MVSQVEVTHCRMSWVDCPGLAELVGIRKTQSAEFGINLNFTSSMRKLTRFWLQNKDLENFYFNNVLVWALRANSRRLLGLCGALVLFSCLR